MGTARLWAVHDECEEGMTWLVIDYFDGAERANWDSAAILAKRRLPVSPTSRSARAAHGAR
jgi:hypothetical protein